MDLQHDMHIGTCRCVWWGYSHPGVELGRMSLARHGLYMRVAGKLAALGVKYTLPPYQVLFLHTRQAMRQTASNATPAAMALLQILPRRLCEDSAFETTLM